MVSKPYNNPPFKFWLLYPPNGNIGSTWYGCWVYRVSCDHQPATNWNHVWRSYFEVYCKIEIAPVETKPSLVL